MIEHNQEARIGVLADCPYCAGEGTDPATPLGICSRCYGKGRIARFLAERVLERWAKADGDSPRRRRTIESDGEDGIEDEVPPGYTRVRHDDGRATPEGGPWSRRR